MSSIISTSKAAVVIVATALVVSVPQADSYVVAELSPAPSESKIVVASTPTPVALEQASSIVVSEETADEQAEYDRMVIANLGDEPASVDDGEQLDAVEWVPGVGLIKRS